MTVESNDQAFAASVIAGFAVGLGVWAVFYYSFRRPIMIRAGYAAAQAAADGFPPELSAAREPFQRIAGPIIGGILLQTLP